MNKLNRFFLISIVLAVLTGRTPAWAQQAHSVVESEPNDTPARANRAALGDTLTGSISNDSDVDFFVIDIPAGTFVRMADVIQFCFFDQDGNTLLTCNSGEYGTRGYPFTTSGRYYLRLRHGTPEVGVTPMGPYGLVVHAESFSLDAGDPARRIASLPPLDLSQGRYPSYEIWRMAAGLNGELYVTMLNGVLRIGPDGDTTTLAADLHVIGNLAVDAFGDVIVGGWRDSPGALWKISPTGELSQFRTDVVFGQWDVPIWAVAPDGDLWVGTNEGIAHLDPTGAKKAEIPLQAPYDMVVGPSGELYVAGASGPCEWGVAVVQGADVECPLPNLTRIIADPELELAIDRNGALYVGEGDDADVGQDDALNSTSGHVDVFPLGSKTSRHYAHVPGFRELIFGRDAQGNMTSRLFAVETGAPSRVVELGAASDRPVGAGFAVRFFHATMDPLPSAMFDVNYSQTLHITTDTTPLTWSIANGAPPRGLTLSSAGVLQGTPGDTGTFEFTVRATSGVRSWFAPGTIRVAPLISVDVSITQVVAALLGGPALSPAQVEYFDQLGNKNGILDVGDLRAYLRAHGQLH